MGKRRARPKQVKELASSRISELLQLAEGEQANPARNRRYASLARRTSAKYNVAIPCEHKRRICKGCGAYLTPGRNLVVRLTASRKQMVYRCLLCGHTHRYAYSGKRSPKKHNL